MTPIIRDAKKPEYVLLGDIFLKIFGPDKYFPNKYPDVSEITIVDRINKTDIKPSSNDLTYPKKFILKRIQMKPKQDQKTDNLKKEE